MQLRLAAQSKQSYNKVYLLTQTHKNITSTLLILEDMQLVENSIQAQIHKIYTIHPITHTHTHKIQCKFECINDKISNLGI